MCKRTAPSSQIRTQATVRVDHNDPEFRARTIGEALFTRVTPSHKPSEAARPYIGLSIPEIARDCLRTRGYSTTGLGSATVIERALQSTSDFPLLLADTVNRTLRMAYKFSSRRCPAPWARDHGERFSRQASVAILDGADVAAD